MLNNKVILITGATSGIGRELAITCAKHQATVIVLGKNKKKLEKLYDEIMNLGSVPEPLLLPFNLAGANPQDYQDLALEIAKSFNRLDGLVHNAATLGTKTELIHYDILKWYETLQVNLNAPFLMTQALLPVLKLSKQASIIFTTANEGMHGQPYQGAYGVSKAGINNFMQILASELESHTTIRVNSINPNKVYSGIYNQNFPATDPSTLPSIQDIMPLYIKLLGDFTAKYHGLTFKFNGSEEYTTI